MSFFSLSGSDPFPFRLNEVPLSKDYSKEDEKIIQNFNTKLKGKERNNDNENFLKYLILN